MLTVQIVVDGDGALAPYKDRVKGNGRVFMVTGLANGMTSGEPSVGVVVDIEEDLYFAETSLKLFLTAADALKARYGDPR